MAIKKILNDCDMIITVAAGRDEDGNELMETHKFSKIKVEATDENINTVGQAIIDVINHSGGNSSVDKVESYSLMTTV